MAKLDKTYMAMAELLAKESYAVRKKVGCLVVKDNSIISDGYNGTPSGTDNSCEDENNTTHWYVLHAEANAILKLARSSQSSTGATMYVTLSPCKDCSKLVLQAGIKRLVFKDYHRDTTGLDFLKENGVIIEQLNYGTEN